MLKTHSPPNTRNLYLLNFRFLLIIAISDFSVSSISSPVCFQILSFLLHSHLGLFLLFYFYCPLLVWAPAHPPKAVLEPSSRFLSLDPAPSVQQSSYLFSSVSATFSSALSFHPQPCFPGNFILFVLKLSYFYLCIISFIHVSIHAPALAPKRFAADW